MEKPTDTENDVVRTIRDIFDWPLDSEDILRVYDNFYSIIFESIEAETSDWKFFSDITKLDVGQRRDYRNKLADLGYELRPDELNQYVCIIMLAMINVAQRNKNGKTL